MTKSPDVAPAALTVAVAGASGKQGGAVARELLRRGHHVRALTRAPTSSAAAALRAAGAEVVAATFDDAVSLQRALTGADSLFAVGVPWGEGGTDAEVRHGKTLVRAAAECRLKHVVYSSIASADRLTGIPFFESKLQVERAIEASGLPYTVLGPVFFMENIYGRLLAESIQAGRVSMPLAPGKLLQQVAVADIGRCAAAMFEAPQRFIGRRMDIASDEVSGQDMARALSAAAGRPFRYEQVGLEDIKVPIPGYVQMFEFLSREGYAVDLPSLHREVPEAQWLRYEDWATTQRL